MVSIRSILVITSAFAAVMAAPTILSDVASSTWELSCPASGGGPGTLPPYNPGNYVVQCSEPGGSLNITNSAGSSIAVSWDMANMLVGKGWSVGGSRSITYSGTYEPSGNSWIGVFGWTRNPLAEYFIVDNFGTRLHYNPAAAGRLVGNITTDGGLYMIYRELMYNAPSIDGIQTYQRYWSVRVTRRVGGTITTQNHFNAWQSNGLFLGNHNWQIVGVRAFYSRGRAEFYVVS
ncbi:endo-1,4-beta-xylanase I [Stachybotrys elegans]|uniref:Endo-1,4-beta-xylanase n=1 Tax=Stachybotrys elegans TaxID=80388 RepID=A0A8K0SH55_9HYPO|nr:endo-1,4-beta-xylanase I [Stachybotrys elegans]